jgi:hypothetical protein
MVVISIISGLLATMNIWVDKVSDMSLSLNDLYMALLMTGWMIFFMGLYDGNRPYLIYGALCTILILYFIRSQTFIWKKQYYTGMIPHHSMAILMSKDLLNNDTTLDRNERAFVQGIIKVQENEIKWMKNRLHPTLKI